MGNTKLIAFDGHFKRPLEEKQLREWAHAEYAALTLDSNGDLGGAGGYFVVGVIHSHSMAALEIVGQLQKLSDDVNVMWWDQDCDEASTFPAGAFYGPALLASEDSEALKLRDGLRREAGQQQSKFQPVVINDLT